MSERKWVRVSRDHRCPVCDRPDWCLVASDRSAAICARVNEGSVRRIEGAGWLHRFGDRDCWRPSTLRRIAIPTVQPRPRADLVELAGVFRSSVRPGRLAWLAGDLGVSSNSLARLGIGWCDRSRAWSFPMVDVSRNVLGIRLRTEAGRKFAVRGGREGLFIPDGRDGDDMLLVAEGPTDTAALLDLDFVAIGRPSCRGGRRLVLDLIGRWRPASVIIVSDNDAGGQGQAGAAELARHLAIAHRVVRVVAPLPGIKDARAWVRSGATRFDFLDLIRSATPHRVSLQTAPAKGGRRGF